MDKRIRISIIFNSDQITKYLEERFLIVPIVKSNFAMLRLHPRICLNCNYEFDLVFVVQYFYLAIKLAHDPLEHNHTRQRSVNYEIDSISRLYRQISCIFFTWLRILCANAFENFNFFDLALELFIIRCYDFWFRLKFTFAFVVCFILHW